MKKLARALLFSMAIPLSMLSQSAVNADIVIYEASDTNSTEVVNTSNNTDNLVLTGDTNGGTLLVNNTNGNFNNGGFASTDDINTLHVGTLSATDTLTFTATVDSITGLIRANGFTFGLTDDPTVFGLGAEGLGVSLRANNATVSLTGFQDTAQQSFAVTEASMKDGFTITLTADSAGYTFALTDLLAASGTITDISGTFAGTEFIDNFSNGSFYATTQKFNAGAAPTDTIFSEASISIESIPEPSSIAFLSLTGLLVLRRRRS